jgi:choline dehydrogenase
LIECGDPAVKHPETLRADGYKDAFINDRLLFDRFSVPQAACAGRRIFMGSGRGMGGSGSVNAMVYTRGAEVDYDEWPEGWRWRDVAPHFDALEKRLRVARRPATAWSEACIAAAEEAGFRRKTDLNDGDLSGVLGYEWMNFEGDRRRSSYVAFLRDRDGRDGTRPNLVVLTGARAHRIVLEGHRAIGVELRHGTTLSRVRVRREVVLCAGALETPKLLMLSGIGPSEALRRHGLPSLVDVPSVGDELHDHPNVQVFFHGSAEVDCHHAQLYGFMRTAPRPDLPRGQADSCYVFYPARSSFREGMLRMVPAIALGPDLHQVDALVSLMRRGIAAPFRAKLVQRFVSRMWGIVVILGKPKSRGTVRVASRDPEAHAAVDPRYLAHPDDLDTLVRGVAMAREIALKSPLTRWSARELLPGPAGRSEESLERFIRANVMTTYHYAGTCRMGTDAGSVVDTRLRVRNLENVRVADASVMPTAPVAALNAPSMLVGFRAAQLLREEARAIATSRSAASLAEPPALR